MKDFLFQASPYIRRNIRKLDEEMRVNDKDRRETWYRDVTAEQQFIPTGDTNI